MRVSALLIVLLIALSAPASEPVEPHPELAPLAPFVGRTWRGEFANSSPEKPVFDVSRWEWALNGQAIRILHSVGDGQYGGETLIVWDGDAQQLRYWYFTTAGFRTEGTFSFDGEQFVAHEQVTGNDEGITEVRSTGRVREDGRLESKSEFLKQGEWVPGHAALYEEAPEAIVRFREVSGAGS